MKDLCSLSGRISFPLICPFVNLHTSERRGDTAAKFFCVEEASINPYPVSYFKKYSAVISIDPGDSQRSIMVSLTAQMISSHCC